MKKKLIAIYGIITIIFMVNINGSVIAESDENDISSENKIIALGLFQQCPGNGEVYGYVLIGFSGMQPFFNTYISICHDSIQDVFITNFFLYIVYTCEE